jgi:hypothetical protein
LAPLQVDGVPGVARSSGSVASPSMRRLVVFVAGGLGIGVFWRRLRRRGGEDEATADPAAELRAKLAETKASTVEEPEPQPDAPEVEAPDPLARRQAVHDRARAAMDELG